jgi:hypothetical protein
MVLFTLQSFSLLAFGQSSSINKGNVTYDFTFAELAIQYLETGDSGYLFKIAETDAAIHIFNHANKFNYDVPKSSTLALVKYLLTPIEEKRKILPGFKRNLVFAKDSIAETDLAQTECLKMFPKGFEYNSSTHLFFTFGYDLGVTIAGNASVNLAHPHYLQDIRELKYYSIHELHHAGFLQLKNNAMVDLNIHIYSEMVTLIEYYTHLEGMGTYAPFDIRQKEHALNADHDYIVLQDSSLIRDQIKKYFEIYYHFKNNPQKTITDEDWNKISILSDKKRLWYTVGAKMAKTIDEKLGREKLTNLLSEPSVNFIKVYLAIKNE